MKVAVVGSRSFNDYELMCEQLDKLEITEIISGGAKGADTLAERYADDCGIDITIFKPDWDRHGIAAGKIRNTDIVASSDLVVAFWDGTSRGTADSIKKAKAMGKQLIIVKFD